MNQGIISLIFFLLVAAVVIQAKPKSCKDKLSNCDKLAWESCKGKYKPWALKNCRLTCGLCDEDENQAFECKDYHANCDYYTINKAHICDEDKWNSGNKWGEVNCRKFCGLCDPTKPFDNNTSSGGRSCKDNGAVYEDGMRFFDGCWDNKCLDGLVEGVNVFCHTFDLPKPSCFWKPNPNKNKCCDIPVCPNGTAIKYPYWFVEN